MPSWRRRRETGGGVLLDLASHEVDLVRWVLGQEIAAVESAEVESRAGEQDAARLELRTGGGVAVSCSLSYGEGQLYRWEVEGTEATMRLERWPPRLGRRRRPSRARPSTLVARVRGLPIPKREPSFALALRAFVDRALGGPSALPTIADGRRSLEVVLAAEARAA